MNYSRRRISQTFVGHMKCNDVQAIGKSTAAVIEIKNVCVYLRTSVTTGLLGAQDTRQLSVGDPKVFRR